MLKRIYHWKSRSYNGCTSLADMVMFLGRWKMCHGHKPQPFDLYPKSQQGTKLNG